MLKCKLTPILEVQLYKSTLQFWQILYHRNYKIFFTEKKRERVFLGENSSPGCRARRLLAELMLP